MHSHIYCENHAQDVTVAATYVLEHLGIAFRLYLGYNQRQCCAVFDLLKNHWFWFLKNFRIRESQASVF
jgi:hypothetical protein